jgi:hypothetical protein
MRVKNAGQTRHFRFSTAALIVRTYISCLDWTGVSDIGMMFARREENRETRPSFTVAMEKTDYVAGYSIMTFCHNFGRREVSTV